MAFFACAAAFPCATVFPCVVTFACAAAGPAPAAGLVPAAAPLAAATASAATAAVVPATARSRLIALPVKKLLVHYSAAIPERAPSPAAAVVSRTRYCRRITCLRCDFGRARCATGRDLRW